MIPINPDRFLADLHHLRSIGARGSGVVRPAFSADDVAARGWLLDRMRAAGLAAQWDASGTIWGLAEGRGPLTGSHADTQPEGGWLDGALGVIAGLEVARAAQEAGGPPVSVVAFQDEEGRFGALTGSEIWTGRLSLDAADALADAQGLTFAEARRVVSETGGPVPHDRFTTFLELHIEQGPVLDSLGGQVGAVDHIVGARQIEVTLEGQQNHAGTTPMPLRRDAVAGFAALYAELAARFAPILAENTVWTIGAIEVSPNAASIVPGSVRFTLQWRDASEARLADMEEAAREAIAMVAAARQLRAQVRNVWALPPTPMDADVFAAVCAAAEETAPGAWRRMPSGALHDAANVAQVLPTGMIFVPSKGGISHNFAEDTAEDDLVAGLRVLASAIARLAQ